MDLVLFEQSSHHRIGEGFAADGLVELPATAADRLPCAVGLFFPFVGRALPEFAFPDDRLAAFRAWSV